MHRPNRSIRALPCALLPALLLTVACNAPAPGAQSARTPGATPADPHQIHWERSLDDALAIAAAEHRPLLIALNMDGESASDRIVREEYRDAEFVAASRRYVCLVGSLFRHNAQDYDANGKRIPCPRLGCCTCGEHIALEPLLYAKFLSDGERVAPRHAAILPDGSKPWDLSLSFDLQDIDKAVIATAATAPEPAAVPSPRSDRMRTLREAAAAAVTGDAATLALLDQLADRRDLRDLDVLRLLIARLPVAAVAVRARFVAVTTALGLGVEIGTALRERIQTLMAPAADDTWLPLLAAVDAATPATRAFLLACRAAGYPGSETALVQALGADLAGRCEDVLGRSGGPFALGDHLAAANAVRAAAGDSGPPPRASGDEMPTAAELLQTLEALDKQRAEHQDDAAFRLRYAKASLDLGRRHLETNEKDVQSLLEDAEANFAKALALAPDDAAAWIERARCAYFRSQFEEETIFGREALRVASGAGTGELDPSHPLDDPHALEALRWIADGCVRRCTALVADQPAAALVAMAEAMRAAGAVAVTPTGDDVDWTSFAAGFGAFGLWREQYAVAYAGALRVPDGRGVRQCLDQALWSGGAADLCHTTPDAIATAIGFGHRGFADASWYAGYGWMLRAEQERRRRNDGAAALFYAGARERFATAARANADYADSCAHFTALCWVGEGLAAVQHGDRRSGADALVLAVAAHRNLAGAVDGLGYDVLDLVDKIGEWRADGPSPVDALKLLDRLDAVAADDPFWAVALADSQLREALRADGRNPERAMQDTVDAGGNPIRMLLGLPNAEGDGYLQCALALLHRKADLLTTDDDKKALAQADTIWAERNLLRARTEGVRDALTEAAELLGRPEVAEDAALDTLHAVAKDLRAVLGEARPRWRNGR